MTIRKKGLEEMESIVKVGNNELQIKMWNGQRVVTLADIDRVHERTKGTAKKNFQNNKKHFLSDVDYFEITRKELRENFSPNSEPLKGNPNIKSYLFTESGYLLLVKSFTDDLAWKVQRELINTYFNFNEIMEDLNANLPVNVHEFYKLCRQTNNVERILGKLYVKVAVLEELFSHNTEEPTLHYIGETENLVIDPIRDVIKPLAELYDDGSNGYNCTFRKVYKAMNCDWKYRKTRYMNSKGNEKLPSKMKLIAEDDKLLKLFVNTVNQLIQEATKEN